MKKINGEGGLDWPRDYNQFTIYILYLASVRQILRQTSYRIKRIFNQLHEIFINTGLLTLIRNNSANKLISATKIDCFPENKRLSEQINKMK
jgi:hypothetical protein